MTPALKCNDLRKYFDGTKAVDGLSLCIEAGSIVSLIGPNGAGKTTLFNVVTGFLRPDTGQVYLNGNRRIDHVMPHRIAQIGVGRTFQHLRIIGRLTALDNVRLSLPNQRGETIVGALLGRHKREERVRREEARTWLEYVGIAAEADTLGEELSYGQQKLLSIACCLALGAHLLLLDEPVAGVSSATVERILELIRQLRDEEDRTIVLIEHNMDAVMSVSDRVIAMDQGRIIADGTPEKVRKSAALIDAYVS